MVLRRLSVLTPHHSLLRSEKSMLVWERELTSKRDALLFPPQDHSYRKGSDYSIDLIRIWPLVGQVHVCYEQVDAISH